MLKKKACKFEELLSLIGILVAACPAVRWGWLFYKELEILKCMQGPIVNCDKNRIVYFSDSALRDLVWWKNNIEVSFNVIRNFAFKKEIFSDVSLSGWGATCEGKYAHGFRNEGERKLHINALELLAALLAIKCFTKDNQNLVIRLWIYLPQESIKNVKLFVRGKETRRLM